MFTEPPIPAVLLRSRPLKPVLPAHFMSLFLSSSRLLLKLTSEISSSPDAPQRHPQRGGPEAAAASRSSGASEASLETTVSAGVKSWRRSCPSTIRCRRERERGERQEKQILGIDYPVRFHLDDSQTMGEYLLFVRLQLPISAGDIHVCVCLGESLSHLSRQTIQAAFTNTSVVPAVAQASLVETVTDVRPGVTVQEMGFPEDQEAVEGSAKPEVLRVKAGPAELQVPGRLSRSAYKVKTERERLYKYLHR